MTVDTACHFPPCLKSHSELTLASSQYYGELLLQLLGAVAALRRARSPVARCTGRGLHACVKSLLRAR